MKVFLIMALTLFMSGCANAQSTPTPIKLDVVGESLPTIKHINDMKMKGNTLLFVYESEDGDGQRLLRRAVVDIKSHTLRVSPDMGKRKMDISCHTCRILAICRTTDSKEPTWPPASE